MVVLWFTNTPCGATQIITGKPVIYGGWLSSLAYYLSKKSNINLHIAFYSTQRITPFCIENIEYHPIYRIGESTKCGRYINRLRNQSLSKNYNDEIQECLKIVKQVNPEVIHIHGSEENYGLISEYVKDIKIVLSIQGLISVYSYKYYSGLSKHNIALAESRIKSILFDGENGRFRSFCAQASIEKRILNNIPNIIGRTEWDKVCSLVLNPSRKYFKVNEIMRPEFYNNNWKPHKDKKKITLTTILSNGIYKGFEVILKAAQLLRETSFEFTWKVIGLTRYDDIVRISERITKINSFRNNIEFCGRIDAGGIVNELNNSDIYIQVSHIENSSNSLCEAMLLGIPIIASCAGGTSSLLENKVSGLIIQDGDPYSLAGTIIDSINNYTEVLELGAKARRIAMNRHSPESVIKELLDCYNSLIRNEGIYSKNYF